jgi:predicted HD superfamily hydrolase involved in NAD metabolism
MTMREKVIRWLNQNVPKKRVKHILGVEEMSIQLAIKHNCDPQLAAQAGLMHDLAKFFSSKKLLKIAQENHLPLDHITQQHPHLLHADVSAIIAQQQFGIDNPLILDAISNHTLGQPEMNKLSCIVFIADKLEPSRGDTPPLNKMRHVSQENLYKGLAMVCDHSLHYLLEYNQLIHPRTILTRNWALSSQIDNEQNPLDN